MVTQSLSRFLPSRRHLFLERFIHILERENVPLEIVTPKGQVWATAKKNIRHRLVIKDNRFFNALIFPDAFSLGQAYVKGYFDISGNIQELYDMACSRLLGTEQARPIRVLVQSVCARYQRLARAAEKKNIAYHYDVPTQFYRRFLGRTMGYTCGYYGDDAATMDQAQEAKMEIICRKLRLKKGETLLDIGCGWGNFLIYAVKHYGVKAVGITLSREQKAYALEWAKKENLSSQIQIQLMNYRDLGEDCFDKIACVGMSEHVGKKNMPGFFERVFSSLKPGGLFLQHTITTHSRRKMGQTNAFLDTYMFPGGQLLCQDELVTLSDRAGFELLGAENFRPHYVKTLSHWIQRMETHKEGLLGIVPEQIFRIYHVFFIGSMICFRDKEISLFQNLFYKPGDHPQASSYFLTPYLDETITSA